MTKEQLEKMFDEKFISSKNFNIDLSIYLTKEDKETTYRQYLKDFIFENIIPEVLKSIIPEREKPKLGSENQDLYIAYCNGQKKCIIDIKRKAKEIYNIDL